MRRLGTLSLVVVLVAAAAACGRDDNNSGGDNTTAAAAATTAAGTATTASGGTETTTADTGGTETTAADIAAKCASEPLEATEVGITPTDITIEVMADVGSPLAPGLFQGSIDGVEAWAKTVNANGGVGCRQVKVRTWDSKLTPDDTTNGTIDACQNAVAMVGSTALFTVDPSNLATCKDKAGKATGVPDIAERAVEIAHQCNPTTFSISTIPGACPYSGGVRKSNEFVAPYAYYKSIEPGVHGIFLLPGDLPGTLAGSLMNVNAIEMSGNIINDGAFKVSGSDTQASYARFIQTIKDKKSTFAQSGSNDVSMVKLRKEAKAQGVNTVKVWACSLACYTPTFLQQGGADVEGTYLWTQFVPLEEADAVPELQNYIDAVGGLPKTTSWGVGAWSAGLAFQQVVDNIVATDGPNAITREKILAGLKQMQTDGTFNANGIYGEKLTLSGPGTCFMMMQVQNGKFVRVFPEERGKLSCPDNPTFEINLDPSKLTAS
jgi:hypothetical protein